MAFLAAYYGHVPEAEGWDDRAARNELFARIRQPDPIAIVRAESDRAEANLARPARGVLAWYGGARWTATAAAACLLIAVGAGAYKIGSRADKRTHATREAVSAAVPAPLEPNPLRQLSLEKKAADDLLAVESAQISRLQKQISGEQHDLAGLRSALHAAEERTSAVSATNSKEEAQLRQVSEERDKLAGQVRDGEKAYQLL